VPSAFPVSILFHPLINHHRQASLHIPLLSSSFKLDQHLRYSHMLPCHLGRGSFPVRAFSSNAMPLPSFFPMLDFGTRDIVSGPHCFNTNL
jgi:hypothetical protein